MSSGDVIDGHGDLDMAVVLVPPLQVQILRPMQQLKSYALIKQSSLAVLCDELVDVVAQIIAERAIAIFRKNEGHIAFIHKL